MAAQSVADLMEEDHEYLQGVYEGRIPKSPDSHEIKEKSHQEGEAFLGIGTHEPLTPEMEDPAWFTLTDQFSLRRGRKRCFAEVIFPLEPNSRQQP